MTIGSDSEEILGRFSLTHVVENLGRPEIVEDSTPANHFGFEWHVSLNENINDIEISVHATEDGFDERRRRISVQGSLSFLKPEKVVVCVGSRKALDVVLYGPEKFLFDHLIAKEEVAEEHAVDGKSTIQCDVVIWHKVVSPRIDFSIPNEDLISDVVLVVEDRQFHASKAMLANFSKFFKHMFFSNFLEAGVGRVTLHDLKANALQEVLDVIYHKSDITSENACEIFGTVAYLGMESIGSKCEAVIDSSNEISMRQKLVIADKYALSGLMAKIMEPIETITQLKEVTPFNVDVLTPATIRLLLKKFADICF